MPTVVVRSSPMGSSPSSPRPGHVRTPVDLTYELLFKFSGTIEKVTIDRK